MAMLDVAAVRLSSEMMIDRKSSHLISSLGRMDRQQFISLLTPAAACIRSTAQT